VGVSIQTLKKGLAFRATKINFLLVQVSLEEMPNLMLGGKTRRADHTVSLLILASNEEG
jgi:hypothetical protein